MLYYPQKAKDTFAERIYYMKKFLQTLLLLICIGVFCFSAWKLFCIWQEYHAGDEIYDSILQEVSIPSSGQNRDGQAENSHTGNATDFPVPDSLADLSALKEINPYAIGWIRIPDTNIDYPVLQTDNNDDYLRRTITGESNKAGCIFVDYRSQEPFCSANTIVYGHNLLNGKMFSNLMKYEDQDWYREHTCILIQTSEEIQIYEVYSCYRTADNSETYTFGLETGTEAYRDYLERSVKLSLYSTGIEPADTDQILTLSTCTNESEEERFVVHARLCSN